MNHRVLFVDDEPELIAGIKTALRKEPFDVLTANSAAEAMEVVRTEEVHVVVSDERMPGTCGSVFLTELRQEAPDVVRILLTGQASLEAAVRAVKEGGVYRFLLKPQRPDQLAATIHQALEYWEERQSAPAAVGADESAAPEDLHVDMSALLDQLDGR